MATEKKCCVPTCNRPRSPGTSLHRFPNPEKDPGRFRTWLYNIGGNILALDNQYIFKYRNVCHNHFESQYITSGNRLTNIAIPSLQMQGISPIRRQPLVDITSSSVNVRENMDQQIPITSTSKDEQTPKERKKILSNTSLLQQQIIKLKKVKVKYASRLKKAMKLAENSTFKKTVQKFTTMAAIFTLLQFREIKKPKMGRRFTQDERIMALSLYKQGPKAYRWLRKIFVLPAPVTLSRMITKAALKPGINENIFQQLKKVTRKMKNDDKLCILLFDEIALCPHFDYNRKQDRICGFVNNGKASKQKIADHALVFMIRGVVRNYKQPISYTFCSGSTGREDLIVQIKTIIMKLNSIGLKVIATVCDQGSSNVSAVNYLINETRAKYLRNGEELRLNIFEVDDQEVIPLYDPPHLIKGIRNNLITKKLKCMMNDEVKTAKWEHILHLYRENPSYKGIRMVKNLTENHVNPEKMNKQKVKFATQLFSRTVATNMGYLAEKGILPMECKETADILLFFDNLFDSVNGSFDNSKKRSGKDLLLPLTPKSSHQALWDESRKVLKTMKFVTSQGRESSPPSINNWLRTIENMEYLKKKMFNVYNIKSIWLRHFNQDPLEKIFGCIRSQGYQNIKPSCAGFEGAFASLLINNLSSSHSPSANCEADTCTAFKSLNKLLLNNTNVVENAINEIDWNHADENVIVDFNLKKENPRIIAQLQYVTGYVLRQGKKKVFKNCSDCKKCLFDLENTNEYIKLREYKKGSTYLCYPSNDLVKCFSEIQDLTINVIRTNSTMSNIKEYMKTILCAVIDFNFIKCNIHRKDLVEFIFDLSCRFFLCNWCRDTNKILNGNKIDYDTEDVIQKMSVEYYKKRQRKKI